MSKRFEIHTSCGKVFNLRAEDMDCEQIARLIEQNPDHPEISELKAVQARREKARMAAYAQMEKKEAA